MTSELNKAGLEVLQDALVRLDAIHDPEDDALYALRDRIRAYLSASHQTAQPAEAEGLEVAAWPLAGYAPGSYMCLCATCGEQFMGDKRAVQCLTCAARAVGAHITALQAEVERLKDRIAEIERTNDAEEIDAGLTDNGNLWRFWARKANDVVVRLMDAKTEVKRLQDLFKTQSDAHATHVKGLLAQHEHERLIYGNAAQAFRVRSETAEAEVERLRKSRNLWDDQEAKTRQRAIAAEASLASARQQIDALREALEAIAQFGSDTLSGRADGPDDRKWQRDGVLELTRRARAALREPE